MTLQVTRHLERHLGSQTRAGEAQRGFAGEACAYVGADWRRSERIAVPKPFFGISFFWISKIHTRPEGRGALAWVVVVVVGGTVVQCGDAVSCVVEWSCRRLHGSRRICVGHSHGHSLDAPCIDKSDCTAHGNQFCPRGPRKHHGKHVCPPMCPCMCPPRHRPRAAVPRGTAKHTPSQAPSAVRAGARRKEKDQRTRRDET
jgi:hypothetical protein